MTDAQTSAGGRATEAGMTFQAAVTTWFAVQLLTDMPVGARFNLPKHLKAASLQCEVEAIGGQLELVVTLPAHAPIRLQHLGDATSAKERLSTHAKSDTPTKRTPKRMTRTG